MSVLILRTDPAFDLIGMTLILVHIYNSQNNHSGFCRILQFQKAKLLFFAGICKIYFIIFALIAFLKTHIMDVKMMLYD
jgi:hypothetical protein